MVLDRSHSRGAAGDSTELRVVLGRSHSRGAAALVLGERYALSIPRALPGAPPII